MRDLRSRLAAAHPRVRVWAAGGVILRKHKHDGGLELLLIHRPDHDDWSFPKGKLEEGETLGRGAEREVLEETGYQCRRMKRLPEVVYTDGRRCRKLVVYWTMEILNGEFVPNEEVDAVGWFNLTAAEQILTYRRDRELLDAIRPVKRYLRMPA